MKHPFPVPSQLSPALARVDAYWRGLLRGNASMPFSDDARLTDLPDLAPQLLLVDVFERPERFRFSTVGAELAGDGLAGLFLDETTLDRPFEYLRAQCSATVEAGTPTGYRREAASGQAYSRLLLPLWGEGRISMLLGAVDFG
ncbi:hypothetical protein [Phenylobacterium montanum]|uniref:PAS domain-containing protein n=1 Tax=Phenylobacterium montanum TaxID=2823693 RepID=A0A975IV35_9CAUL|nr:hypothetical protein [Caulobacter sp. S6]QUD86896.1 hypothetical protein KCG34_17715 [Caulobacter sp. S6]